MNATSTITRLGQLVVLALIFTGSHAFGQTITQTGTFVNVSGSTPLNFNFASFNTSLGTLTGVTVELTGVALAGTAQGENDNAAHGQSDAQDIQVNLIGKITVSSAVPSPGPANPNGLTPLVLNVEDAVGNEDTHVSATTTPPGNNQTPIYTYTTADPVDESTISTTTGTTAYSTTGTITTITLVVTPHGIGATAQGTNLGLENTAFTGFSGSATVSGTLELIYTYTAAPVPEPSKTAAIFIGFAMCVLVGRNYFKGQGLRQA